MEFSDIALAKLLQVAPELAPLILNFSDLSDQMGPEGNGTKVGIFILRAGAGIVTIPVISKGDSVLPIDSVFIDSECKFRPLSPATTAYIMNMATSSPGKVKKIPDTVDTNPNLQNLINPPRTGKFTYASASRLTEFMASLPESIKEFAIEKIAAEQSVYDTLDKMFGLKAIFTALNGHKGGVGVVNTVGAGPSPIQIATMSVVTSPREVGALMNDALSKTFIDQGYVVIGDSDSFRTAVAYQPYNEIGTFTTISPALDAGREFDVVMKDGSSKRAYLPKYHKMNPDNSEPNLVSIFEDGNYAKGSLITNGDAEEGTKVLTALFDMRPPKLLRDLDRDETFLLFTVSGEALGPFRASSVTRTATGTEVGVHTGKVRNIKGYNNFTKEVELVGDMLFVPNNIIVFVLGENQAMDVEASINWAAQKKETILAQHLGAELNIRHDGVEFSANGKSVGSLPLAMKYLVEEEKLDPDMASTFLKQAEEVKFIKLFLSKAASTTDFNPTEIPQYGAVAPRYDTSGPGQSFMPAVKDATELNDSQVLESTIISQLLQIPELFEYISEYLPDIEETTDKLGRILMLIRLKMDQASMALDSDTVYAIISQVKTVYRQLGDTALKLKGITEASLGFKEDQIVGQTNG